METNLLVNLYYSLVYSHIIYGIHVWGSASLSVLGKIQVLQNKAVRVISKVQHFQIYGQPLAGSSSLIRSIVQKLRNPEIG